MILKNISYNGLSHITERKPLSIACWHGGGLTWWGPCHFVALCPWASCWSSEPQCLSLQNRLYPTSGYCWVTNLLVPLQFFRVKPCSLSLPHPLNGHHALPRWDTGIVFFFLQVLTLKKIFFNCNIDLQCYVSFRCTAKWFSFINKFSFSDSFSIQLITKYWVEFPMLYSKSLLFICFIHSRVHMLLPNS